LIALHSSNYRTSTISGDFFERLGRAELLKKHLEDLEKTNPPGIDEEIRMLQEFTSEVAGASKAQYTVFGTVWYTHQLDIPLGVRLFIAISPRGLEEECLTNAQ
jgi:hypothetical protein